MLGEIRMSEHDPRLGNSTIRDFVDEVLVECPGCQACAVVLKRGPAGGPRITCGACGRAKDGPTSGVVILGEPVDPYFHARVWLQIPCAGHVLWAYNEKHLDFLRSFVSSKLRRHQPGTGDPKEARNKILTSRLPRWMKVSKNRETVLTGIGRLESRLRVSR